MRSSATTTLPLAARPACAAPMPGQRRPGVEMVADSIRRTSPGSAVARRATTPPRRRPPRRSASAARSLAAPAGTARGASSTSLPTGCPYRPWRGVGVDSSGGRASGASARANLASPSLPCPYCAGVVSAERIPAEPLGPAGRAARAEAGRAAVPEDGAASVASPPRRPPAPRRSFSAACFSGQPDRMRARQWPTRGTWRRGRCRPGYGPAAPARRGRARAAACQCRRRARGEGRGGIPAARGGAAATVIACRAGAAA